MPTDEETMPEPLVIRALTPDDRAQWQPLWRGYLEFYNTTLPETQFDLTWQRFHDPLVPLHALGAFRGSTMLGIVHYLFHASAWTRGPYCYLQDLFTAPSARGHGVGRALIAAVTDAARAAGADRVHWLTQHDNHVARALYDDVAVASGFIQYRTMLNSC
jgi:ribosomal protein S18 acetylase RimI-like enzyme